MMHFQDPHNWDIDRIHKCDIHYATPDGRILPFCTFNVIPELYRDRVQRKFSIPAVEWEKRTGKKLQQDKHHRQLTKEEQMKIKQEYDIYRKYKERIEIESDWGEDAYEDESYLKTVSEPTADEPAFIPIANLVNGLAGAGKTGVAYNPSKKKHSTMENPSAGGCSSGSCDC